MTPFLVVGDFPGQPTGLSRILGDLLTRISGHFADRLEVGVCGYAPRWEGLPTTGTQILQGGTSGRAWAFSNINQWGLQAIQTCYRSWYGSRPGIIFTVWDPGRCYELMLAAKFHGLRNLPVELWGYFPIDGENINGVIAGPPGETLRQYDRVLAYTQYGGRVIARTRHTSEDARYVAVEDLPHGIDTEVWRPHRVGDLSAVEIVGKQPQNHVIGCVATNQARKDLGLVFHTVRDLRELHGVDARLWLHVDREVGEHWAVPQLAEDFRLGEHLSVTNNLDDPQLAACYRACSATIAPGRGEGFGYPIVESLACGTPVVHANYAGGAEYTPEGWRIPVVYVHPEGPYAIGRPILSAAAVADTLMFILRSREEKWTRLAQTCVAFIEDKELDWERQLWKKWERWIEEGLTSRAETLAPAVRPPVPFPDSSPSLRLARRDE